MIHDRCIISFGFWTSDSAGGIASFESSKERPESSCQFCVRSFNRTSKKGLKNAKHAWIRYFSGRFVPDYAWCTNIAYAQLYEINVNLFLVSLWHNLHGWWIGFCEVSDLVLLSVPSGHWWWQTYFFWSFLTDINFLMIPAMKGVCTNLQMV